MKAASCVPLSFLLALLVLNAATLRWNPTPKNGGVVYSCADQEMTFAWGYTLDPGDVISTTEWTYEGRSQEMVAISAHGNFFATPAFSHRVQLVRDAGLILHHVTLGDAGNYTVTVTGLDSSGVSFTTRRTVQLQVAEALMTTDQELHVGQSPVAEYNNVTHQWHSALQCGRFTFPEDPPMTVEWETPEGQTLPSTLYSHGYFILLLPNPVVEGSYTCKISASTRNVSCDHGDGHQASVEVNGLLTRLTLLEAKQERLVAENVHKDAVVNELSTKLATLQAHLSRTQAEVSNQSAEAEAMRNEVRNLTSCPTVQSYCYPPVTGPCEPGKHVVIDDPRRLSTSGGGNLCDDHIQGWYRFLVNGSNAVIPTSCVSGHHCQTDGTVWVDLRGQPLPGLNQETVVRACENWDSNCCHWETPITVRNCGRYFVYKLQPPMSSCSHAYCVELQQ